MDKEIKIKSFFGQWKAVEKDQAVNFVSHLLEGITTTSDINKKIKMIEGRHLQGISVNELLNI
jgi:hypothetical protein